MSRGRTGLLALQYINNCNDEEDDVHPLIHESVCLPFGFKREIISILLIFHHIKYDFHQERDDLEVDVT